MRLRCVGDAIVTDDLVTVATFAPQLLPTIRDRAEELLMRGAAAGDWELRERVYEYETRIFELEEENGRLKARVSDDAG